MIYIFTGDGKGKTSAALGVMLRGLSQEWKVCWISWYKESTWQISEHKLDTVLTKKAQENLQFYPMGKGFYIQKPDQTVKGTKIAKVNSAVVVDDDSPEAHKTASKEALAKASACIESVDLLILDEICNAVSEGLLEEKEVLSLLEKRKNCHVILTGRSATPNLQNVADLVSEVKKIKHPFDSGGLAVQGLDY